MDSDLCFSFSGLKTSLMVHLKNHPLLADGSGASDVAASYQEAIVDALVKRCERVLEGLNVLAVGGGVSLNSRLREVLRDMAARRGVQLLLAEPKYCGDNAAMIAGVAGMGLGVWGDEAMLLDAEPNLPVA
jgi:N6-L-threonylcarbamoyladenine synthase